MDKLGLQLDYELQWNLEFQHNSPIRKVVNYKQIVRVYEKAIKIIQKKCEHEWSESRYYAQGVLKLAGGIMPCSKCDLTIEGWWCPSSETHQCDYEQKDGTFNDDNCIHCHHPNERK